MADQKMVDRIKALLAKAESTTHEAEADAFIAKAQELMMKYAVDEAMLAAAGKKPSDEIVTRVVEIREWMHHVQGSFLTGLAHVLNCRTYYSGYRKSPRVKHHIVGYESDAVFVELLFASVAAQGWRSALSEGHAGRTKVTCEECSGTGSVKPIDVVDMGDDLWKCDKCKGRGTRQRSKGVSAKSYLDGYFSRVLGRCQERYARMEESVGSSVALALRDKGDLVDQWMADHLHLTKGKAARRRDFDAGAYTAGHKAGANADISGGRGHVKGAGRKELQ